MASLAGSVGTTEHQGTPIPPIVGPWGGGLVFFQ